MDHNTTSNEPIKAEGNLDDVGHETTLNNLAQESCRGSRASQRSDVSEESERASLDGDGSVASQKSGVSNLADRVGGLKVTSTGFVHMDGPTKRRFKKALSKGLTREAALAAAQVAPEENRGNDQKGQPHKAKTRCSKAGTWSAKTNVQLCTFVHKAGDHTGGPSQKPTVT